MCKQSSCSAIVALFQAARPTAIVLAIIAIVIHSFNGMSWTRPRPHVLVKGFERLLPPIADFDTTASIVFELFEMRIATATKDAFPAIVFRSLGLSMLSPETTTADFSAQSKNRSNRGAVLATIAATFPEGITFLHSNISENDESPKAQSLKVEIVPRGTEFFDFRHDLLPPAEEDILKLFLLSSSGEYY